LYCNLKHKAQESQMPTLTASQISQLRRASETIVRVLDQIDLSEPVQVPEWRHVYKKRWRLLKAVDESGSDIGADEWGRLGRDQGYDPRGLGGFFQGSEPMMAKQGARRVLTAHGHRFIERWAADFS
jgi:hypothetical protein